MSASATTRSTVTLVRRYIASPENRWSDVGNREFLTGVNEVGVLDLVAVGFVDLVPFAGVAVNMFGDLAQRITAFHGIGLPPAAGGCLCRRSARDVREVRCWPRWADVGASGGSVRKI